MANLPERLDALALATLNRTNVPAAKWLEIGTAYAARRGIPAEAYAAMSQGDQGRLILEMAHELLFAPVREHRSSRVGLTAQSADAAAFNAEMTPTGGS